jgi:hypothetical protein
LTFAFCSYTFAFVRNAQAREESSGLLSLALVERLLDLPKGSARKRRLTVLAVSTEQIVGTALRRGDRLVVEPGTRSNTGYLLACRSRGGIVLRRLRVTPRGEPILAAPDEDSLPLADGVPCTVLGTVLAVIRTGDEVRVAFAPRYAFGTPSLIASSVRSSSIDLTVRRANSSLLRSFVGALTSRPARNSQVARQLEAVKTRLMTLGKCLDVVEDERIYCALVREINVTVLRLRRTFTVAENWIPLSYDARDTAKRPRRTQAATASGQRRRQERSAKRDTASPLPLSNAQRQIFGS